MRRISWVIPARQPASSPLPLAQVFQQSPYAGRTLLHAQNGIEAVDACHLNSDIDLILMDMKMPEMGGLEATQQIRKFNKDVVIIAQTAFGQTGKAIEAGCNDYISKPINKTELLALIQKYFKK